jgi:SAM-dependent methyltransferase
VDLPELKRNWDMFGATDPLWSIYTAPGKEGNRWDPAEFFETGELEIAGVMDRVEALDIDLAGGSALDFGCGVGRLTQPLCNRFGEVHGVDIAPSMIALANDFNRHAARCFYHLNESGDLRIFDDGEFDFIYSSITLQHMLPADAAGYIREFFRVLRPGGLMVFQLPDRPNYRRPMPYVRLLTPAAVHRMYIRAKYRGRPRMEMYGTRREDVLRLIEGCSGAVAAVDPDNSSGRDWISWRYFVVTA